MKSLETIINEEVGLAVERIMRASQAATMAAFEQRFSLNGGHALDQQKSLPAAATTAKRKKSSRAQQRSDEEIAALEERLLTVVRSNPGQPLATLAPQVGATPTALRVPVVRLKTKKQLKLVGRGQLTCYFPMDNGEASEMATTRSAGELVPQTASP